MCVYVCVCACRRISIYESMNRSIDRTIDRSFYKCTVHVEVLKAENVQNPDEAA